MAKKLSEYGYRVEREKPIPVTFAGIQFEVGFRADLIIEDCFIVELKSAERLQPVHGFSVQAGNASIEALSTYQQL